MANLFVPPTPIPGVTGLLKSVPTVVYTVSAAALYSTVRNIVCPNLDDAAPHPLSVWIVRSGNLPSDPQYYTCRLLSIPAAGLMNDDDVHTLGPGDMIVGQGDVDDVFSMRVDCAETTP